MKYSRLSLLIFSIFFVSFISAYYPGETLIVENQLHIENLTWTIIENTSELTILPIVSYDISNITIYFPTDMNPNSFKIVFLEEQTRDIVQVVDIGRSHTRTIYQNQTEYVPVYITKYVDRYIESNQTPINNTIIPEEKDSGLPLYAWGAITLGAMIIIWSIFWFLSNRNERREENEEVSSY
jgi:hypothetical protein